MNAVAAAELDGRPVVISGSDDRTVRVWDLATGAPVGDPFTGHNGSVNAVAAAELDGRPVVISGSGDRTVRVWDLATGAPVGDPFTGHGGPVNAVAVAELDGRPVVVSGSDDRTVRVWDLATGAPVGSPFASPSAVLAVTQFRGRPVVVSGISRETIHVWDLATHAKVGSVYVGFRHLPQAVAAADLGGRLVVASGGVNKDVRVWDGATGALIGFFYGHSKTVSAVALSELDGRPMVISASWDGTVRLWDLHHRRARRRGLRPIRLRHPAGIRAISIVSCANELQVVTACADNIGRTWSLPGGRILSQVKVPGHSRINAVAAMSPDRFLYSIGSSIYLHNTGEIIGPALMVDLGSEVLAMAAHDGTAVVATQLGLAALEMPPPA